MPLIITLILDWMRISFSGLVIFISSIVIIYRTYYIRNEKYLIRFILLVYLFVLSIIFLIFSPNIIRILLGWDGLGLVSYCLVIHYQNLKSMNAGMVTILSNRIGDVAILIRISWLLNFGSWNFFYFQFIYVNIDTWIIIILVIIAAITKRAQIPFSAWLPAAIAAPTPVSALVHSSTLVTAGVYLLIRFSGLIGFNNFLLYIGCITIFIAGLSANFETDLKKIIALSTLSQLGLIILTLGIGYPEISFFHLMTHAMFKSLLFLCAGVFIHSLGDIQDIRIINGLHLRCPVTSFYFIGASMALCGFPFLTGFYSKDLIIELYFTRLMNIGVFIIILISTIFTVTYSVRLIYYVYINNIGGLTSLNIKEEVGIFYPISFLIILSILAGGWVRLNLFPHRFIYLPILIKILILISLIIIGVIIYFLLGYKITILIKYYNICIEFFTSIWFLPSITRIYFIPILKSGSFFIKTTDRGWSEYLGGLGLWKNLTFYGSKIDFFNLINLKIYLFILFFFLIIMLLIW